MRNYVTVVTGVPRSGTSMMMRMLDAGGIRAFTDGYRLPDIHNPGGYFEYGPVKRLAKDSSWMDVARNHSLKVIYRLLRYLPDRLSYRVIFMERDLADVFESQRKMLLAASDPAADQPAGPMIAELEKEITSAHAWLDARPNMQVLPAPYEAVLETPEAWCADISRFLGGGLDEAAMTAVIDPALRRSHAGTRL
jgi:hypothetical protein